MIAPDQADPPPTRGAVSPPPLEFGNFDGIALPNDTNPWGVDPNAAIGLPDEEEAPGVPATKTGNPP